MPLKKDGRQIKAVISSSVGDDLDRLQSHLGLTTLSNVIALAIRKLAIAEFRQNRATSLDETKEVAA
jgi:hypothetical protein